MRALLMITIILLANLATAGSYTFDPNFDLVLTEGGSQKTLKGYLEDQKGRFIFWYREEGEVYPTPRRVLHLRGHFERDYGSQDEMQMEFVTTDGQKIKLPIPFKASITSAGSPVKFARGGIQTPAYFYKPDPRAGLEFYLEYEKDGIVHNVTLRGSAVIESEDGGGMVAIAHHPKDQSEPSVVITINTSRIDGYKSWITPRPPKNESHFGICKGLPCVSW